MTNSKILMEKLKKKYDERAKKSNRSLWNCLKRDVEDDDNERDAVPAEYSPIETSSKSHLSRQVYLLRDLMKATCRINNVQLYFAYVFGTLKLLKATGFDIDDKWLVNIMLANLDNCFDPMLLEIESSKGKLTSELLKNKILEYASKRTSVDQKAKPQSCSKSVVSNGSFRGDGEDPAQGQSPPLSADELLDTLVGRCPSTPRTPPPRSDSERPLWQWLPPPPYPRSYPSEIPPRNDALTPREPSARAKIQPSISNMGSLPQPQMKHRRFLPPPPYNVETPSTGQSLFLAKNDPKLMLKQSKTYQKQLQSPEKQSSKPQQRQEESKTQPQGTDLGFNDITELRNQCDYKEFPLITALCNNKHLLRQTLNKYSAQNSSSSLSKSHARNDTSSRSSNSSEHTYPVAPIQKLYLKEVIFGGDGCLLSDQMYLLSELMKRKCYTSNAHIYLKQVFDIVEQLKATGFDLDDKWLVNIMLANLDNRFSCVVKEIESSKVKLTSELLRYKILEHANKRYYCSGCKRYSSDILCSCGYMLCQITQEIRNGKKVKVFRNY